MRVANFPVILVLGLLAGCVGRGQPKPVQALDERTGVTLASLKQPIELVQTAQNAALAFGKRASFAYLGPIEWDRAGTVTYSLWMHVAPGNGRQAADIHVPAAVTLVLDDGPLTLTPIEAPKLGRPAYKPVASWGQVAYFALTAPMLERMAASRRLELDVRATDDSTLRFSPTHDARAALTEYLRSLGLTGD